MSEGASTFSDIEKEVVVLTIAIDMIGAMVNRTIVSSPITHRDTNLFFESISARALFNILLSDFLSQPGGPAFEPKPDQHGRKSDLSFLFYLRRVAESPQLGVDTDHLKSAINAFADWLDVEADIPEVHLGEIELQIPMRIRRVEFLKITGDIAKHNIGRMNDVIRRLRELMRRNGHPIVVSEAVAIIPDFQARFHDDILIYHASTIVWFLNEIRWEIWSYLQPEFEQAIEFYDPVPLYRFLKPAGIKHPMAARMHWDLMNIVRTPPAFPRFTVTSSLQQRY